MRRVFINHNLTIPTKVAVYKAVCVSVLLYGCEGWTPYRRHIKALEAFHIRSLQIVLGIRWWQKVPHTEMFSKAAITPVEHLQVQRQLRWLGHVIRMPSNRLPRRLLYGELSAGQRPANRPKKWFMDHVKSILLRCSIDLSDLEAAAADRDEWRAICEEGLDKLNNNWISASEKRRTSRRAASMKPKTGPQCPHCSTICASAFGLRSHLRTHLPKRADTQ